MENSRLVRDARVQLGCGMAAGRVPGLFIDDGYRRVVGARGEREAMAVRNHRAANPAPSSEHAEVDTA